MKLAGFTVLFAIVLILVVDLFIVMKYGYAVSVSAFVNKTAREWPIVTFLAGVVVGHLVWPLAKDNQS